MVIHAKGPKGLLGALMAGFLFSASIPLFAQTFDTPPTSFILEGTPGDGTEEADLPATLNIGNFDPSIQGPDGLVLNEVVIAAMSFAENDTTLRHRYWTIVHDNAADPRSLVQTAPSDILVTDPEDPFYFSPSSLQVVDLNGDGSDDIAFTSLQSGVNGTAAPGTSKNIATGAGPASVYGVPSQAGPNFFETSINVLGGQTEGSMFAIAGELDPNFAAADFDGDGVLDLAFYDFSSGNQLAVSLQNNGSLGTLPRTDSQLNLPPALAGLDSAINLVAADIDGDGPVDLAITVSGPQLQGSDSFILAYKGNGDGSFVSDPMVTIPLADQQLALSLAAGNFDGNEFLDFAAPIAGGGLGATAILIALCSPGTPASCTTEVLQPALATDAMFQIVSADFDEDGLDDLANSFIRGGLSLEDLPEGGAEVRINQGGSFPAAADQTLPVGDSLTGRVAIPIATKDIDGCGGPDLAYTAFEIILPTPSPTPTPAAAGIIGATFVYHASVAFNHNDDPVADAGSPVSASGGFQVGGDPTCLGELGENLTIEWEVVSGEADISDPAAANPIVNASQTSVLQVTCTDACGASSSATVTVQGGGFLISGTGCSLGGHGAGGGFWLLSLAGLLPWAIRGRHR